MAEAVTKPALFVYGTLLFEPVMRVVTGRCFAKLPVVLPGYQCWKVRGASYPGIIEDLGSPDEQGVRGELCLHVDEHSLARLDAYEDAFYERRSVQVTVASGLVHDALCYVVPQAASHRLEPVAWQREQFEREHLENFLTRLSAGGEPQAWTVKPG